MTRISKQKIQQADETPFNNAGLSITSDNLQAALPEIRNRIVTQPEFTTTVLNANKTLTNLSNTLHIFNGTALNQSITLPNATTAFNGLTYEIWNFSSEKIDIRNSAGTLLTELRANAQTTVVLRDNTTAIGSWGISFTLDSGNVFGSVVYFNEAIPETSTNSTTVWSNKLTLTTPSLAAGNYLVQFQFIWRAANASRSLDVRIRRNGADIEAWQPFTANLADRQLLSGFVNQTGISGVQTLNIEFKVNGTATTVYLQKARMFIWRIG